ncbi:MAG TPA: alkaline phosphatase family protein [Terriglobales bacterium]|nr:alkaline phosphatase family protein [Terriglobales bacterium]
MTDFGKSIHFYAKLSPSVLTIVFLVGCQGLTGGGSTNKSPDPGTSTPASLNSINHIILFMQENRSFDHYFGQLNVYRAAHGMPQDVDTWGPNKTPEGVATASYNPATGTPGAPIAAFHMRSVCSENLSPSWNESHRIMNLKDPTSNGPDKMDGAAFVEGKFAFNAGLTDVTGRRAMGYYDASDLPFYYFMASNFATSDRWYSAVPTRTHPNRFYWMAATSQGFVTAPKQQLSAKPIFAVLDKANITWKIYMAKATYYSYFTYSTTHKTNVVPLSEYFVDVRNGTLPQVAYIETGVEKGEESATGVDEHPNDNIQIGAQFSEKLITALMQSPSWKDSVFIQTYDEGGGLYDHVSSFPVPSPDGIKPILNLGQTQADFTKTGFRVPLMVISPFSKKNYVSHTNMDFTATLKFIETRFKLPSLTARDASMPDMTEFFDFSTSTGPWATPPSPPTQPLDKPCSYGVPQF